MIRLHFKPQFDETFFDAVPSNTKQPISASGKPFKLTVKPEPNTPQRKRQKTNTGQSPAVVAELHHPNSNSSSCVFAGANDTDDIIMIEESQPMRLDVDNAADDDADVGPTAATSTTTAALALRTEYRQHADVRTAKEKAAQPGFMCPDCAPVSS